MSSPVIAERYALALFQLAKSQNQEEKVDGELRAVKKALKQNPEFIALLGSPKVTKEKKQDMIRQAFPKLSSLTVNTLMLLTDKHRQDILIEAAESYNQLLNDEKGVTDATVYSVKPLNSEEIKSISTVFAAKVGKKSLNIENVVDEQLLGGIRIRIGNRIFDGSLKGKLDRLSRKLTS